MHIALLGPVAPPAGGVQSHIAALRRRIQGQGHRASLVAITRSKGVASDDVFFPRGPVDLLRTLRSLRPDVVHLHFGGDLSLRLALLCAVVGQLPNLRSVLTFHSGGFPGSPRGLAASKTSLEGFALRQLDAVIAVNTDIAGLFARYGLRQQQISTIAPYARLDPAQIPAELPAPMATFFDTHSPVFIAVGLLEPEYTLKLQIEALPLLRALWPNAGLMLIGSGSLEAQLRQQIANSTAREHIDLRGDVAHAHTLRAIQRADVLLRTTRFDGDAVSVREALQLGTAVVATDTGMRPPDVALLSSLDLASLIDSCTRVLTHTESGMRRRPHVNSAPDELDRVVDLYNELRRSTQTA